MKNMFKEYHQFNDEEIKQLWKNGLFVFDTNTLLNMYRYSRTTVDTYFKVLEELKKEKKLWIPYQVGYEFYENRINIISEYENSYDCILDILNKAKTGIEAKYKDHPFLNLCEIKKEMDKGLSVVERKIKNAKKNHPKWIEKDDVLENLNKLFEGNIGKTYNEKELADIKKEGKDRYEKKIPPGFKDDKKPEDRKYGDLILRYQIIDKAKETKKPIILISGDVKEDRWLEKEGKRLMPLPKLKKEIAEKADVDFHIYTADKFLEYYMGKGEKESKIDKEIISEVRKVREGDEKRMILGRSRIDRDEMNTNLRSNNINHSGFGISLIRFFDELDGLLDVIIELNESPIDPEIIGILIDSYSVILKLRENFPHKEMDRESFTRLYRNIKEIINILNFISNMKEIKPKLFIKIKKNIENLENIKHLSRSFL